ncbi:glycoprotein-N-acetylgalactosamine 3-beta-galactosyltransferase 1-like [Mya arenaria]|uniref:glycoprotein-N-acetylgalactosamine 3-beta-galactosyltransferase 1-like n=1 Tax=Mya arenaria TaxID=6604 RepID=UPI0022DF9762|nr:glycoprotein-N-acetylgalactosamine 3-beta-galactosyltransferase 1-like [Mya arenaria]
MQGTTTNLSKFIIVSLVIIFTVVMSVYFMFSNKVMVPAVSEMAIGIDVGIQPDRLSRQPPLTHDDVFVDETEAQAIFDKVRIYCWILTTKSGLVSKAAGVNFTWAPRCNKHVFFASASGDETILNQQQPPPDAPPTSPAPTVNFNLEAGDRKEYQTANGDTFTVIAIDDMMFIDSPEGYDNLTEKSREVLQYLYIQEMENFDWFLKADDDTYVIMENMRFLLHGLDPDKPAYMGFQLEPAWFDSPYMSGGAGYVFNRAGLKVLVEGGIQKKGMCQEKGSFEDLEVGRCALRAGVPIYSSVDRFERESFHPDHINDYIPGPPPQWLYFYARNKPKGGSECCSQLSVTFHRMQTRDMLVFDHLLYKTHVFGRHMIGSYKDFFTYKKIKKLPNGVPTVKTT